MDGRISWLGDAQFGECLCDRIDSEPCMWFNGGVCDCENALEIFKADDDVFPDRNDGADSLRIDSVV